MPSNKIRDTDKSKPCADNKPYANTTGRGGASKNQMVNKEPIKNHVEKIENCNPIKEFPQNYFHYIDLSSLNKETKSLDEDLVNSVLGVNAPSRAKQKVIKGDILVSTVRPNLNGVAVINKNYTRPVASTGYCVLRTKESLDNRYLFHWLLTSSFIDDMVKKATGANYPAVSDKIIKSSSIPLPPLATQKKIAAILDEADQHRQLHQQLLAKYDQLTQSLFLEMFGDPVTNPKGFIGKDLGEICGVGSSKRVFVDELVEKGVPFYRGTEIGKMGEGENVQPSLFITRDHYNELAKHTGVPKQGDLLMPSICPDGRIYIVKDDHEFYFKDGRVLWVKINQDIVNGVFMRYHLKEQFRTNYLNIASGTTFAELKIVALKNLEVLVPPIDLQNQFAERVQAIEAQKAQAQHNLEKAEALFQSLLQRAFKGELV